MFNTEKLIHEVKIRDNLWNYNSKNYLDRVARRQAWEEISQIFHHGWEGYTSAEKTETVDKLMRKWRNVRDYYIKEKKKNAKTKLPGVRKKKYNYHDCLTFLNAVIKQKRRSKDNSSSDDMVEEYLEDAHADTVVSYSQYSASVEEVIEDSNDSSSADLSRIIKQEKEEAMTANSLMSFETHMMEPADRSQEEDNIKANKNFLLSLLPDLTSLNERQNMKFRLGVLNLLNGIKFELK